MSDPPPVVSVRGGVAGVEAQWAALRELADVLDRAGDDAREWAGAGVRSAADPDLLASAPWSPLTCAAAEAALLRAAAGPEGALGRALAWERDAVAVRAAGTALVAADHLVHDTVRAGEHALGGAAVRLGAPLALVVAGTVAPLALPVLALPAPVRRRLTGRLGEVAGEVAGEGLERAVVEHPGAVETAFGAGGGVVDAVLADRVSHRGTPQGAGLLASLYDDGTATVRERPDVVLPAASTRRPADLAGLVGALAGVAALSTGSRSPLNGTIAVTTLRGPGGTRHVVFLPGTDDMTTTPWSRDHDVRDMGTNLALAAGRPTTHGAGVLLAMQQAGIGPHEPVLLVGHSQGGMQAAALAADPGPFHVTDVVTAGAPLAQVPQLSDGPVHTLSLENRGDVVPLTDGAPNRPGVQHVTVVVDAGGTGVADHHAYPRYEAAATAVEASPDRAVAAAVQRLHDAGWVGTAPVEAETRVFQLERAVPGG